MCTEGAVIHEFLPTSEIFRVAEAILRVFHRYGDYQHKQRNRMKFMIKSLGWARWRDEYDRELAGIRLRGEVPTLDIDTPADEPVPSAPRSESPSTVEITARVTSGRVKGPGITPVVIPVLNSRDEDYSRWRASNVRAQKQFGYAIVEATVPLGDMTSAQMRVIGDLAKAYGDGTVRVTMDQNLVFRWVKSGDVRALYARLAAAGLGLADAGSVADVASCPGAESCRLAVTQSRGLGRLLEDHLRERADLIAAADGTRIKISGCPNGRAASHRHDRLPGQRSPDRRARRASILRHGRRRDGARRRVVRTPGGQDSRAAHSRGGRPPDRDVRAREERRGIRDCVLRARQRRTGAADPGRSRANDRG